MQVEWQCVCMCFCIYCMENALKLVKLQREDDDDGDSGNMKVRRLFLVSQKN